MQDWKRANDGHSLTHPPPPHPPQIPGEGVPVHNFPSQLGSMHVKFIVDFPKTLTPEQIKALDAILPTP